MQLELESKTEAQLQEIIDKAEGILKSKSDLKQKEVIAQIKELAASINMKVEIYSVGEPKQVKKDKIPFKYRDPANPDNTWKGRGLQPKWLKEYIEEGRQLSEFLIEK